MFVKSIVVLLLLIVLVSLMRGGATGASPSPPHRPALRPMMLKVAGVLLALGLAVLALHLSGCSPAPPEFHATRVDTPDFARLVALEQLADPAGHRPASADFQGKVVVTFFGYARCPDICPTTLATMKQALALLGEQASQVRVQFVTLDPERDTPEVLADYIRWFDPRFVALRGDAAATQAVAREFKVFFQKKAGESASGYSLDHSATSYVHDPQGRLRLLVRHGASAEHLAADLRQLLAAR